MPCLQQSGCLGPPPGRHNLGHPRLANQQNLRVPGILLPVASSTSKDSMAPLSLVMALSPVSQSFQCPGWYMVVSGHRRVSKGTKASESRGRSTPSPHQHLQTLEWHFLVPLCGCVAENGTGPVWLSTELSESEDTMGKSGFLFEN